MRAAGARGSSRRGGLLGVVVLATLAASVTGAAARPLSDDPPIRSGSIERSADQVTADSSFVFPVAGEARLSDDWHQPRDNGARLHMGNDIGAAKHTPLVAVTDGVIVDVWHSSHTNAGNTVILEDARGWRYAYMHLNNDAVGTDNGRNRFGDAFAPGLAIGVAVSAGEVIGYVGDSGNAEPNTPHLHFEITRADGVRIDPFELLSSAAASDEWGVQFLCRGRTNPTFGIGPSQVGTGVAALADARLRVVLGGPDEIVDVALHSDGRRVWAITAAGGLVVRGGARRHGAPSPSDVGPGQVAVEPTPTGDGFWLLDTTGHVRAYGDATDYGSPTLDASVAAVDLAATSTGRGYHVLASDARVSAHGDAVHMGSPSDRGAATNFEPVMIEPTPDDAGYWILADDGRVATFGDAVFRGRWAGGPDCEWPGAVGAVPLEDGTGWWIMDSALQTWAFGGARGAADLGDLIDVGAAATLT